MDWQWMSTSPQMGCGARRAASNHLDEMARHHEGLGGHDYGHGCPHEHGALSVVREASDVDREREHPSATSVRAVQTKDEWRCESRPHWQTRPGTMKRMWNSLASRGRLARSKLLLQRR